MLGIENLEAEVAGIATRLEEIERDARRRMIEDLKNSKPNVVPFPPRNDSYVTQGEFKALIAEVFKLSKGLKRLVVTVENMGDDVAEKLRAM